MYRSLAVNFLNTDDNGNPSPFSSFTVRGNFGATYDSRVRGMGAGTSSAVKDGKTCPDNPLPQALPTADDLTQYGTLLKN